MTWWFWVIAGTSGFVVLSVVVGLAVATILGRIGDELSHLTDIEVWASTPSEREAVEVQRRAKALKPDAEDAVRLSR
jgi:hypothetical protein